MGLESGTTIPEEQRHCSPKEENQSAEQKDKSFLRVSERIVVILERKTAAKQGRLWDAREPPALPGRRESKTIINMVSKHVFSEQGLGCY